MDKKEYFKFFLFSLVFSLSFLISLPRIPFVVKNFWFNTISYIGGYEFKYKEQGVDKTVSISNFKPGLDIGGGVRTVFQMENSDSVLRDRIVSIVTKRLQSAGISDFRVVLSQSDNKVFSIEVPKQVDTERLVGLVSGNGSLRFKKLKSSEVWDQTKAAQYIADQSYWEDSGITEKDVSDISSPVGYSTGTIQMTFNEEGKTKFKNLAKENIGKPIAFYINNLPYPFSMSLVSEAVALDAGSTISFSGGFKKQDADDFILERKLPFSENILYLSKEDIKPLVDSGMLLKYGIALGIGLVISLGFLVVRFGARSLMHILSLIYSLTFLAALLKIFSVEINISSIISFLTVSFLMYYMGYSILREIKLGKISGKPFDLVVFSIFDKERYIISTPMILIFGLMIILYPLTIGQAKQFPLVLILGSLVSLYFYTFVIRSLIEVFGGYKENAK